MAKLQYSFSYGYKRKGGENRDYYKASLNIPKNILEQLGWSKGEELNFEVEDNILKVKPKRAILRKQVVS